MDCDCGIFVATYAEYLIEGRQIPAKIDAKFQRARIAMSLYCHGRKKVEKDEESDGEYLRPFKDEVVS